MARVADAEADTAIGICDVCCDGAQTIVAAMTTAVLQAELGRRQVQLVIEHDNILWSEFVETECFAYGTTTFVHVGCWLHEQDFFACQCAFRNMCLKASPPWAE